LPLQDVEHGSAVDVTRVKFCDHGAEA
jgi:hypothetical protein